MLDVATQEITVSGDRKSLSPGPIRLGQVEDIPALVEFALEAYGNRMIPRGEAWVKSGGARWLEWCILNPERLVLIGANSVGIAQVAWHYGFERKGRMDVLVSRPGSRTPLETLKMVRLMLSWARQRGAVGSFRLDADTGVDFEPFAQRLGGKPVTNVRYEIPL